MPRTKARLSRIAYAALAVAAAALLLAWLATARTIVVVTFYEGSAGVLEARFGRGVGSFSFYKLTNLNLRPAPFVWHSRVAVHPHQNYGIEVARGQPLWTWNLRNPNVAVARTRGVGRCRARPAGRSFLMSQSRARGELDSAFSTWLSR